VNDTVEKKDFTLMSRYDGFFLNPAPEKAEAFRHFVSSLGKKFFAMPAYPTSRRTPFVDTPKIRLFYCGHNWDNRGDEKYFKLWRALSEMGYFETYGTPRGWRDPLTR
jgi:hypothetical protein